MMSWMGVVVGDPKMSPYADVVHDINIIDVRVVDTLTVNSNCKIEIAIENIGPGRSGWKPQDFGQNR